MAEFVRTARDGALLTVTLDRPDVLNALTPALLGGNRSLLHVTWLRRNELGADVWRLPLSAPQYARLVDHVRAALPRGQAVPIAGAHYGPRDAFYEALGSYHLFETCNTWTGRGLRDAGVATGRWTPFDFTVVRHLQRSTP